MMSEIEKEDAWMDARERRKALRFVLDRATVVTEFDKEDLQYSTVFLAVTQALTSGEESLPSNMKIHWAGVTKEYAADIWQQNKELVDELWDKCCAGEKLEL